MASRRVDVGGVPQAELDVDRRRDADQLRDLVVADEAADVVRRLDVEVERDVDRGADRGDLRRGVRSVGRLIVSAPRSARTRAAGGFAAGSITEIFACMSSGRRPARRAAAKAESTPMSAIRTLRKPWSAARRASSRQATTCSWPRAAGANTPPAGARAAAEVSQAAFGRAKRLTSTRASAASRGRVVELVVGEHEDAAALRDTVDGDVEARRLLEHGLEATRALGARDLDPVLRAVGKALRRVGQVVQHPRAGGRSSAGSRASRSSGRPYLRRLGLLEQRLPPLEQPLELVARGRVRSQQLGVPPVLGELPLELGDGLLLRGDLRSRRALADRALVASAVRPVAWLASSPHVAGSLQCLARLPSGPRGP